MQSMTPSIPHASLDHIPSCFDLGDMPWMETFCVRETPAQHPRVPTRAHRWPRSQYLSLQDSRRVPTSRYVVSYTGPCMEYHSSSI